MSGCSILTHSSLTWLAAAKCHRCSRRFSGSFAAAMCLRFLGRFKRFAAVGASARVLRGSGEWLEEDPRSRLCMLNRRNYTRNGHDWNPMPDMELESLRGGGGSYIWKGDLRKGGFGRTPRTPPPWLRACDDWGFPASFGSHCLGVRRNGKKSKIP